jgi:aryl-alcohol dehydrogenase-like predicted oxidoreductase
VSSQIPFSLLRREFQHDLPFCAQHGIGVTPYQPLQSGLLTGKYSRGQAPPADSRAAEKPDWIWQADEALHQKLDALRRLADEASLSMTQYSLAWALGQPAIQSLIVGVKSEAQLRDAVAAAEVSFPTAHAERVDEVFPPPWSQSDPVRG